MKDELRRLERRRGRSGKDTVDHPPLGSDDVANAVAGAVNLIIAKPGADPHALLTGVGKGIGYEIRERFGSTFDQPMFGGGRRLSQGIPVRQGYDDDD